MHRLLLSCLLLLTVAAESQALIKHLIPVADSKIYVEESGEGPAVILLHAGNMDHRLWAGQVPVLSKQYRVLNVDLRGCGFTQDGDSTYLQSDAILAIMDSLQMDNAAIIGMSLGAVAATDFALAYPGKVTKMVLASPGLIGIDLDHDSALVKYQRQMDTAYEKHNMTAYTEAFIRAWFDGPLRTPAQLNKTLRKRVFSMAYDNITKRRAGVHLNFTFEPTQLDRLSQLHMPILVMAGTADMKDILMIADAWKKKGAKVLSVPGVAHLINMEQPAVFNQHLLSFLH